MCRCQDPYTGDGVIECKSKLTFQALHGIVIKTFE